MADVRSVAVGFWVGTGSRDEPAERAGASHFLEHLLFKGTPTRSAAAIAEAVDEVGGDCNAFTTKEYTAFYIRLLADHLPLGLDILSEIMWDPALRRGRRRGGADGDPRRDPHARRRAGRPRRRAVVGRAVPRPPARPGHPRHRGERAVDVRAPTSGASSTQHYRPGNIVVSVAGDCDHDAVAEAIECPVHRSSPAATRRPGWRRPTRSSRSSCCAGRPSRPTSCSACGRSPASTSSAGRSPSSTTPSVAASPAGCSRRSASSAASPTRSGPSGPPTKTPVRSAVVAGTAPEHVDEVLRIVTGEIEAAGRRRDHRTRARRRQGQSARPRRSCPARTPGPG